MEYIYAALLVHKAGKKVDEATVTKVLEAAGVKADGARVKALVASLEGVNIDEAIQKAAAPVAVAAAPAAGEHKAADNKKDEKKAAEDAKKADEQASAGLSALFG